MAAAQKSSAAPLSSADGSHSNTASTTSSTSNATPCATPNGLSLKPTALGPRRFRGDVPAFNPSLPHLYTQQMHHYLSQHLRQQPQYYAKQPYMLNSQMMPYYPMAMGYPDYQMYQQYQYYVAANPFHNHGYVNMAGAPASFYSPKASVSYSYRKKYPKELYHAEYASELPSALDDHLPPAAHKEQQPLKHKDEKATEVEDPLSGPAPVGTTESIDTATTTADAQKQLRPSEATAGVANVTGDIRTPKEDHPLDDVATAPSLPLLFQLTMDEYLADKEAATALNRSQLSKKSANFDQFVAFSGCNHCINHNGLRYIVNHVSGDRYYQHVYPRIPDAAAPQNNTNDFDDSALPKTNAPLAWSAVLQATGIKKKRRDGDVVLNGSTASLATSTTATPDSALLADSAYSPQSLGLLMMTYLFDPTFKFDEDILAVKPRGLTNSGNICYMNVVLQCLIFCEPFARLFHLVESKSIASVGTDSPTPLIDATVNFLKDYMTILPSYKLGGSFNSDGIVVGKPLSPEPFYQKLIENPKFRHLSWGLQEDAEEFLGYLLDGLHEEFVKVEVTVPQEQMERLAENFSQKAPAGRSAALKTSILQAARLVRAKTTEHVEEREVVNERDSNDWSEISSGRHVSKRKVVVEPSPITRLFGGRFRSVLTVPKSKEQQSITLDPFRSILLDISLSNIETIEDALCNFNETEMLLYKVEAGNEVVAKKQTFIDELPEILILHLKRFSYQNETPPEQQQSNSLESDLPSFGSIEKVTKNVLYGLKLAVPPESLSTTLRREHRNNYQLTAVIYHHGRNAEGGHYTCDVFRPGRKWLRIDDTAVEAVEAECVLDMSERDKSAYILLYQRRASSV